jgi:hypothetical protein
VKIVYELAIKIPVIMPYNPRASAKIRINNIPMKSFG